MDRVDCSAVYIDDRVRSEGWVSRRSSSASAVASDSSILSDAVPSLRSDVQLLLLVCKRIFLCRTGASFANKLAELGGLGENNSSPLFAFFDIELGSEESVIARRKTNRASWPDFLPPSPTSMRRGFTFSSQSEDFYGLQLLSGVSSDIQLQETPSLIIPIAVLRAASPSAPTTPDHAAELQHRNHLLPDPEMVSRCLDAGAVEVLTTPLEKARVQGLFVLAYRTLKTAQRQQARFLGRKKSRKHSWVGVHNEQPYAYLREAMVSKLMKGICNPEETIEDFQDRELEIRPEREAYVKDRIGCWNFPAHEFTDDELVFGACEMLQHAFRMPELEPWRLSSSELRTFLLACRAAYNAFVLYHNFRHAIDVLQSVFCFLLHIGALPPRAPVLQSGASDSASLCSSSKSPMAALLSPFDTLTLLISAIGHDVGHPGVNNFFLVKLNAPLAQLYNDNSVLEAFHCAAFSQILRRHWPAAFQDKQLRKLLISSILATDMGVHQKFMERLGSLQERFHESNRSTTGWKPQDVDMYKTLLCGLLIKCADISNVARPWDVAESWTKILQLEFANQGEMEKEVGMETALFGGPPELGNVYKLATGQIGFMSIFAIPLFEGVSDILPQLRFTVEQIRSNQSRWHYYADREKRKQSLQQQRDGGHRPVDDARQPQHHRRRDDDDDEPRSPRSQSPAASFKTSRSVPAKDAMETPHLADGVLAAAHQEAEENYGAETVAQTTTRRRPTMHEEEDYFGPISASTPGSTDTSARTASPSGYNEATISPVVSPDTPGPSMDITGSPMPPPPGFVGQKATGGDMVPGMSASMAMGSSGSLPAAAAAAASASAGGSDSDPDHNRMEPLPGALDRNRMPADGSALASWVFANASRHPQHQHDGETAAAAAGGGGGGGESLPVSPGDPRPPSSRYQQRRPHANTNSSTRTSGPSNSQRNSCTRTQSVSTYSNNMTPISPATNATSFLTVDSADDEDDDDKKSAGSLSRSERDPAGSSTRPSTSDPSGEHEPDHGHMTVPVGKSSYSSRSMTGGNRPSSSPPPSMTMTPRSDPGYCPYDWQSSPSSSPHSPAQQRSSPPLPRPPAPPQANEGETGRRLPKRRSRFFRVFWRRRNHPSHQQEVGGEM